MIASGGPRNSPPGTLTRLFFDALAHDKPDAMQVKVKGVYTPISSRTIGDRQQFDHFPALDHHRGPIGKGDQVDCSS